MKNTLGKEITKTLYKSSSGFQEIESLWKGHLHLNSSVVLLVAYALLRGKDYHKGFVPITNKKKLANGAISYMPLNKALQSIIKNGFPQEFQHLLSDDAHEIIKSLLPSNYYYYYKPRESYSYKESACTL